MHEMRSDMIKQIIDNSLEKKIILASSSESWLEKEVMNPATGNMVKVKSLPPHERKRYRPHDANEVFVQKIHEGRSTLWSSSGPYSGSTEPHYNHKGFITSKVDHSNYSDLTNDIVKSMKHKTPLMKKENKTLHELPVYREHSIDVFNKDQDPIDKHYMVVDENHPEHNTINFFKNKNEAKNWMKY